jgi:hypothetical protein
MLYYCIVDILWKVLASFMKLYIHEMHRRKNWNHFKTWFRQSIWQSEMTLSTTSIEKIHVRFSVISSGTLEFGWCLRFVSYCVGHRHWRFNLPWSEHRQTLKSGWPSHFPIRGAPVSSGIARVVSSGWPSWMEEAEPDCELTPTRPACMDRAGELEACSRRPKVATACEVMWETANPLEDWMLSRVTTLIPLVHRWTPCAPHRQYLTMACKELLLHLY